MNRIFACLLLCLSMVPASALAQDATPAEPVAPTQPAPSTTSTSTGTVTHTQHDTSAPAAHPPTPTTTAQPQTHRDVTAQPMGADPTPPPPAQQPAQEEDEGDGRNIDWLWIEAGGGISYVNMRAIKYDNFLPDAVAVTQTSGGITAALGMKFLRLLAFGVRATYSVFDNFGIGTVGAEIGLRIPIAFLEPYIRAGVGYAWMGGTSYSAELSNLDSASVYGFNATFGLGLDFYIGRFFSLGVGADAYMLNLTRDSFDANIGNAGTFDLTKDGHAIGISAVGHGHLTLHF